MIEPTHIAKAIEWIFTAWQGPWIIKTLIWITLIEIVYNIIIRDKDVKTQYIDDPHGTLITIKLLSAILVIITVFLTLAILAVIEVIIRNFTDITTYLYHADWIWKALIGIVLIVLYFAINKKIADKVVKRK